ncbi:MAG: patatin-like phospholipase family protein, partial [Planctomycetota bacterium]|nr:patatin-like phospholipase family protein [Planctomycetota bacterium]
MTADIPRPPYIASIPKREGGEDAAGAGATAGIGVALGGGGGRAFAHLGVMARLAEIGLAPAYVSGSSMGAVEGAIYAASPDPASAIPEILARFRRSSLFGGRAKPDKGDGLESRR